MALTSLLTRLTPFILFYSLTVSADPALQKIQALEGAAIEGDVLAQTELASRYYLGEGVEQNIKQALAWYQVAAKNGDMNAQYSLGNLYLLGEGVSTDTETARLWYQLAANQGHQAANARLQSLSGSELGSEASSEPTSDPAPKVAQQEQGSGDLFDQLFGISSSETTTPESDQPLEQAPASTEAPLEEIPIESRAAPIEPEASVSVSPASIEAEPMPGQEQVQAQSPEAPAASENASPKHYPNSDLQPGPIVNKAAEPKVIYEQITEQNPELFRLYQRAREGDPKAQYNIGNAFYTGDQVQQNHEQAFLWFRRAADAGNANAQYSLGNIYLMGEGVAQSDDQAVYWYEKASRSGHKRATANLYNLNKLTGRGDQPELRLDTELSSPE